MHAIRGLTLFWVLAGCHAWCSNLGELPKPPENNPAEIVANQNRAPVGRLRKGVLTVRLVARMGVWYPEERDGPGLEVQALAEEGGRPEIPGPLIRAPEGTEIRATVRNAIPGATLVVHGLHTRPGNPDDRLEVAPGGSGEVRFKTGPAGTYFYWATTTGLPLRERDGVDSQLSGALIVDPPGRKRAPEDRVFVIGWWSNLRKRKGNPALEPRDAIVINGRSWPHTERLTYTVGEAIHWRWINASLGNHPMHLHGFFYRVDGAGDGERETQYTEEERRLVVTELLQPGSTMSVTWVPDRPGNWLFHCHVLPHISPDLRLGRSPVHAGSRSHEMSQHALEGMAGLVLGLHILPARKARKPAEGPRKLQLAAQLLPGRYGKDPGFGFALQEGALAVPQGSASIPGPPLVLARGQPVSITVVNRLPEPISVHWHGIELESYYDGIAGWSGSPGHIAPLIVPDSSFVAEFTPPRAGTFIYHTHIDDVRQLSHGLYGAIVVLEPGQSFDPVTDRIMLISVRGPTDNSSTLLNGSLEPEPIELRAGVKYRFRFINITPHDPLLTVALLSGASPVSWRALAKDGADLPAAQATVRPARQVISVGETYDFELQPTSAGDLRLEIFRPARTLYPESRMKVSVRIR